MQQHNHELPASGKFGYRGLPMGIWGLGFVSVFMDVLSELVHSLLPVFMATVLGTSMVTIGIIEGFAAGAAAVTKVFSGAISDYCGKRKFLAVAGALFAFLSAVGLFLYRPEAIGSGPRR